jgi:hypothetical protein
LRAMHESLLRTVFTNNRGQQFEATHAIRLS